THFEMLFCTVERCVLDVCQNNPITVLNNSLNIIIVVMTAEVNGIVIVPKKIGNIIKQFLQLRLFAFYDKIFHHLLHSKIRSITSSALAFVFSHKSSKYWASSTKIPIPCSLLFA